METISAVFAPSVVLALFASAFLAVATSLGWALRKSWKDKGNTDFSGTLRRAILLWFVFLPIVWLYLAKPLALAAFAKTCVLWVLGLAAFGFLLRFFEVAKVWRNKQMEEMSEGYRRLTIFAPLVAGVFTGGLTIILLLSPTWRPIAGFILGGTDEWNRLRTASPFDVFFGALLGWAIAYCFLIGLAWVMVGFRARK
jgi:hypothetical protein